MPEVCMYWPAINIFDPYVIAELDLPISAAEFGDLADVVACGLAECRHKFSCGPCAGIRRA